jgi:hypothetical protein
MTRFEELLLRLYLPFLLFLVTSMSESRRYWRLKIFGKECGIGQKNKMTPDRAFRIIRFLLKVLPMLICGTLAVTTNAEDVLITSAVRWSNDKAQFFLSDGYYIRYDTAKRQEDAGYHRQLLIPPGLDWGNTPE